MATKVRLVDGKLLYGDYRPKPKPKAKDLKNGFEVKAYIKGGPAHNGEHFEDCTVIEVNGEVITVSYTYIGWDRPMSEEGKQAVVKTCYASIRASQIVCYTSEWNWHAKVIRGNKVVGLLDPAVLEQLATGA